MKRLPVMRTGIPTPQIRISSRFGQTKFQGSRIYHACEHHGDRHGPWMGGPCHCHDIKSFPLTSWLQKTRQRKDKLQRLRRQDSSQGEASGMQFVCLGTTATGPSNVRGRRVAEGRGVQNHGLGILGSKDCGVRIRQSSIGKGLAWLMARAPRLVTDGLLATKPLLEAHCALALLATTAFGSTTESERHEIWGPIF